MVEQLALSISTEGSFVAGAAGNPNSIGRRPCKCVLHLPREEMAGSPEITKQSVQVIEHQRFVVTVREKAQHEVPAVPRTVLGSFIFPYRTPEALGEIQ